MKQQLVAYFSKEGIRYNIREHGIPMEWANIAAAVEYHNTQLDITIKPTISNYLRVQDIMVLEIIEDIEDDRPVYFAVTVSPSNRMDLDKYLEMEGLVYHLTTTAAPEGTMSPRLNYKRMKNNITQTSNPNFIIQTPLDYNKQFMENEGLYRYTNLNNEEVYFSSNIQRLTQNYRSGFLQLALEDLYSADKNGKSKALSLLHDMDYYFPPSIIPVSEPELDIQIGRIYKQAGEPEELRERLKRLEEKEGLELEIYFYIAQVYVNELNDIDNAISLYTKLKIEYPYIDDIRLALVQIYSQSENYEKAIKELEEWLIFSPNNSQANDLLKYLRSQA